MTFTRFLLTAAALAASGPYLTACSFRSEAHPEDRKLSFTDIAFVYHGAAVDRDFKVIELDRQKVDQVLDSMISTLSVPRPALEVPNGKTQPTRVSALQASNATNLKIFLVSNKVDPLLTKVAIIRAAIGQLSASEARVYRVRLDLLQQAVVRLPGVTRPTAGSKLFSAVAGQLTAPAEGAPDPVSYAASCKGAGVPTPPNWPAATWIDRGALPPEFTFASFPGTVSSAVFTYQPADGSGICYALPRKSAAGSIEAMGVICQAKATGKACFFDNLDATGARITGQTIQIDFNQVRNGYSLDENCTECHRGGNAFIIHPKTPLGSVRDRDPDVRYSPIGQSTWSNPPAMAEIDSGECASCHEIAAPNAAYCGFLRKAAEETMPSPNAVAGWVNPAPAYKAHIEFLKSNCSSNP